MIAISWMRTDCIVMDESSTKLPMVHSTPDEICTTCTRHYCALYARVISWFVVDLYKTFTHICCFIGNRESYDCFSSGKITRKSMGKSISIYTLWPRQNGRHLQWRHKGPDGVSSHQPHDCLLNRLFRRRSKKTSKLRVTRLYAGNSPVTGEFPTEMASNAEHVYIWWRHHATPIRPEIDVYS